MSDAHHPIEIFYSYAHEDEPFRRELEKHLSLLQRLGLISAFHDRQIVPGTDWAKAINTHLETASLILLLISADFLASDYCYGIETQRALERHEAGNARVIPVLLRPIEWFGAPFGHLQALPTDAKPVVLWPHQDEAFADIAAGIRRAVENLPALSASAPRKDFPALWNIPHRRNPFSTGCEKILADLSSVLKTSQATALSQPQAISGLGDIGKTQIAVEYAYQHRQDYQTALWTLADTHESLYSPILADRKSVETTLGLQSVAEQIVRATYPDRVNQLPLTNFKDEANIDSIRKTFAELLNNSPSTQDIRVFISAYHSLLHGIVGYSPLLVPAYKLSSAVPFDFALVNPHGITGPVEVQLIVLGPASCANLSEQDESLLLLFLLAPTNAQTFFLSRNLH